MKRRHDDAHFPLQGRGKKATRSNGSSSADGRLVPIVERRCPNAQAVACNCAGSDQCPLLDQP